LGINEIVTIYFRIRLKLAINPTIALFKSTGIPWDVEMENIPTVCLEVEPFPSSIGGDQDT